MKKRLQSVRDSISRISNKAGVFTPNQLATTGFNYTGDGDTAVCNDCKLKRSNWTLDMNPLAIHSEQQPNCPFVVRSKAVPLWISSLSNTALFEVSSLTEVRRRTFSHWPHRTVLSSEQMIEAGFFSCNIRDRVICIYCNLICQQWAPHIDDPCEVHKALSPNCIYVKAKLLHPPASSILTTDENLLFVNSLISRSLQNSDAKELCQELKRPQQQRVRTNESTDNNMTANGCQLLVPDGITLSKFVEARLDLPISQRLFDEGFKLPIIKLCWKDQLRLKQSDFVSNLDLYMACVILQKQIELIDGISDNIIAPLEIETGQQARSSEIRSSMRQAFGPTTANSDNI